MRNGACNLLWWLCQDWMSLFNSSVFPCHFQPTSRIVQDRKVALAMVDIEGVFERSLSHPCVFCWKRDIEWENVSAQKTFVHRSLECFTPTLKGASSLVFSVSHLTAWGERLRERYEERPWERGWGASWFGGTMRRTTVAMPPAKKK